MFLEEKQEKNKCPCTVPRIKEPYIQFCVRQINEGSSEDRRCESNHKFLRLIYMCTLFSSCLLPETVMLNNNACFYMIKAV